MLSKNKSYKPKNHFKFFFIFSIVILPYTKNIGIHLQTFHQKLHYQKSEAVS